jgi:hypothetical protein
MIVPWNGYFGHIEIMNSFDNRSCENEIYLWRCRPSGALLIRRTCQRWVKPIADRYRPVGTGLVATTNESPERAISVSTGRHPVLIQELYDQAPEGRHKINAAPPISAETSVHRFARQGYKLLQKDDPSNRYFPIENVQCDLPVFPKYRSR